MSIQIAERCSNPLSSAGETTSTFLTQLLRQQREMTAVERFAAFHIDHPDHAPREHYHRAVPLTPLGSGQQYAFDVDLDKCSGCKACVSACHHMNGLETHETWRSVGILTGEHEGLPVLQHVTTSCHHCLEPSCLAGCPTNAYVKDEHTGIVRHLDDQCFGCGYCIMACPYEVPQYDAARGVVRKCDMCRGRLEHGEAPACVQACPSQAIQIVAVDPLTVTARLTDEGFLPDSPQPTITLPTTGYRSKNPLPTSLRAAGVPPQPQSAHWPLVLMLVQTQWSVGAATMSIGWPDASDNITSVTRILLGAAWLTGTSGLLAAALHLGRPWLAFRGALGWRHSWLSREVLAFACYMAMITAIGLSLARPIPVGHRMIALVILPAVLAGWYGVFCSARIYQFTRRPFWIGHRTCFKFLLTTLLLGAATAFTARMSALPAAQGSTWLEPAIVALLVLKAVHEYVLVPWPRSRGAQATESPLRLSRQLLFHDLLMSTVTRLSLVLLALLGMMAWHTLARTGGTMPLAASIPVCVLMLSVTGEIIERSLYFRAVVPLRVPGGINR